jgi:hypothetical protein
MLRSQVSSAYDKAATACTLGLRTSDDYEFSVTKTFQVAYRGELWSVHVITVAERHEFKRYAEE